jgi:hypothetical protein
VASDKYQISSSLVDFRAVVFSPSERDKPDNISWLFSRRRVFKKFRADNMLSNYNVTGSSKFSCIDHSCHYEYDFYPVSSIRVLLPDTINPMLGTCYFGHNTYSFKTPSGSRSPLPTSLSGIIRSPYIDGAPT